MNETDPAADPELAAAAAADAGGPADVSAATEAADTPPAAYADDGTSWPEPPWSAIKRQLLLLTMFLLCVGLLFVLAAATSPYGEGCGGG